MNEYEKLQFLYIDPLKQGLKPSVKLLFNCFNGSVFIHRSIKTRIETLLLLK